LCWTRNQHPEPHIGDLKTSKHLSFTKKVSTVQANVRVKPTIAARLAPDIFQQIGAEFRVKNIPSHHHPHIASVWPTWLDEMVMA